MSHIEIEKEEIISFLERNKGKFKKVLEIGAAGGNMKELFIEYGTEEYIMIDNESEYKAGGDVEVMDAHDMDFDDETYDCVFMSHTAEHFICPYDAFTEIKRVLKNGGIVFSITPFHCRHQVLEGDKHHISVLTDMQWEKLMKYLEYSKVSVYIQTQSKGQQIDKEQNYMCVLEAVK